MTEKFTPLSVREGGHWAKINWWLSGGRQAVALRLAPWLAPVEDPPHARDIEIVRRSLYDMAVAQWGADPQSWPGWFCTHCGQRNSCWALECGRCEHERRVGCPSTHGASGWAHGTYVPDNGPEVVCGMCGEVVPWKGWLPTWVAGS